MIRIKVDHIFHYASVFHDQAFFIFGGFETFDYTVNTKSIGRLDAVTQKWTLAGELKNIRAGHSVIFDGSQFLVIGGYPTTAKTENCIPNGSRVTCTEQQLAARDYAFNPELMLVGGDFGNDC